MILPVVAAVACFSVIEGVREHARSPDDARLQIASLEGASERLGHIERHALADGMSPAVRREFATASASLLAGREQFGVDNADNADDVAAINRRIDEYLGALRRSLAGLGTPDAAREAEVSEAALGSLRASLSKAGRVEREEARVAELRPRRPCWPASSCSCC